MSNIQRQAGTVRIYATGGCGASAIQSISKWQEADTPGYANIEVTMVDTSTSNADGIPPENTFLIREEKDGKTTDGFGQKRDLNPKLILGRVKELLQKFPPNDLNIVVHSGSGGSGSVTGPLIVNELLSRNEHVIVIFVGDDSTRRFTENTLATLKTYENISATQDKSIAIAYFFNRLTDGIKSGNRGTVNKFIENAINDLQVLYSNQNTGMDRQDLFHWLNFNLVTNDKRQVAYLAIVHGDDKEYFSNDNNYGRALSVATLVTEDQDATYPRNIEYQVTGILPDSFSGKLYGVENDVNLATHFVLSTTFFNRVVNDLTKRIKEFNDEREAFGEGGSGITVSETERNKDSVLIF